MKGIKKDKDINIFYCKDFIYYMDPSYGFYLLSGWIHKHKDKILSTKRTTHKINPVEGRVVLYVKDRKLISVAECDRAFYPHLLTIISFIYCLHGIG